jgi:acyl-CoA dehydrogenase
MYTMGTVLRHGNEEQKRKYLPGIASGSLRLQAFGVTEPTTGSDTTQLKTRAEKRGNDRYVINGQKVWTSRVLQSDLMLLLARTTAPDKVKKRSEGLSVFLVDLREAKGNGVEIRKIDAMINHNTCEVFIDNLEVPAENLIGEEGKGFKYIVDSMNAERILIASESLGDAKYFIRRACDYARERVVFGRPIGQNQGVQFPIARAHAELVAAELVVRKACAEANMGKMLAADAAWKAADSCLQTFGGFGFAREYGIERKWRETRLYQTAPISTNMILAYVAQHVLGLPRSY